MLLYVSHHIISDGWSRSNLYRELSIAYTALAANTSVDLPELPVQFADYSARQRRWAKSAAFEEQAAYWKAQLAGQLESLNLPRDGDRYEVINFLRALKVRNPQECDGAPGHRSQGHIAIP